MQVINYPKRKNWPTLCKRSGEKQGKLEVTVKAILQLVKQNGDIALKTFTEWFDGVNLEELQVSPGEIETAVNKVPEDLKQAIQLAKGNIEKFHSTQHEKEQRIVTTPGVVCWRRSIPIEKVGLYIPGGSSPLFSSLLMLGVPAKLAGCNKIIVCTPPDSNGNVHPSILYTARLIGTEKIWKVGGAQAIAAMAYGTHSIPDVDKVFGPGNQYVTMAKQLVQQQGIAIDIPAGPSELLVIADESCNIAFVAADLISQAEHGPDSQVMLVSNSGSIISKIIAELEIQLETLPRKEIIRQVLFNSKAILVSNMLEAMDFSNTYAPEHLIISCEKTEELAQSVYNAGSVFLGEYSCESAGDYASGTNHTLPTNGYSRIYSGVSLESFMKKITFQQLSAEGIRNIGPAIIQMAEAEQLKAHKNAVTLRLKAINYV